MIKGMDYKLDSFNILKKKRSIKRQFLSKNNLIEKRVAILGGSTTAEIRDILEIFLLNRGISPIFYESAYDKYFEDVMFDNAQLRSFNPDVIYFHTCHRNVLNYPLFSDDKYAVKIKYDEEIGRFKNMWQKAKELYQCAIIQNNFELPPNRILGNLEFSDFHGKINFLMLMNLELAKYAQETKGFYINDINYLSSRFGLDKWHDQSLWCSSKYALNYDAIPLLAQNISNIIMAIYGKSKKCLVLDLDNTLWGGIIGEDGANNIQIGKETAVAESYTVFQQYLNQLKDRGVLLSVCSKNDIETAMEGMTHPDNVLVMDDFIVFRANWDPKHLNIGKIAEDINLGLDSFVFIDDNPAEREIVRSQLPEVCVPEIGNDVIEFIDHIDKNGYFEPALLHEDDVNRNKFYKENAIRETHHKNYLDYDEFLMSLAMKAEINRFKPIYHDRITQLINKTNQFNLTTRRYAISEIEQIAKNPEYIKIYGKLEDKFGDNGLVSIIIGRIEDEILYIDLWLMSCRVLKRNLEYAMFDQLVAESQKHDVKKIVGYYFRTQRNGIVSTFFKTLEFTIESSNDNGDSVWVYSVPHEYAAKNHCIEVKRD